jgi:hypothetical protein
LSINVTHSLFIFYYSSTCFGLTRPSSGVIVYSPEAGALLCQFLLMSWCQPCASHVLLLMVWLLSVSVCKLYNVMYYNAYYISNCYIYMLLLVVSHDSIVVLTCYNICVVFVAAMLLVYFCLCCFYLPFYLWLCGRAICVCFYVCSISFVPIFALFGYQYQSIRYLGVNVTYGIR